MHVVETPVFSFEELSADAQETAIEQWRQRMYGWHDMEDWIQAVDIDYWQDCRLTPYGVTINANPRNKYSPYEVKVSESPDYVEFAARIDLETYLRAHKLCNRFRAVFHAATVGDIGRVDYDGSETEIEYLGDDYARHLFQNGQWIVETSARAERLESQLKALEAHITEFCSDIEAQWAKSFVENINWPFSDEAIRETLTDVYPHVAFTDDGFLF